MQAPSPLSRFALFFLLGSLVLILVMLGFLKHLPVTPQGKPAEPIHSPAKPVP